MEAERTAALSQFSDDAEGESDDSADASDDTNFDDGIDDTFMRDPADVAPAAAPAKGNESAPAAQSPAATVPAAAQTVPPVSAPAAPTVAPAAPAAAQPAVASPPAASPAPAATPGTEPTQSASYIEWRGKAVKALSETKFALTKELAEEVEVNPAQAIAHVAADVYMTTLENVTAAIAEMLPRLVDTHTAQQRVRTEATDKFFGTFPGLRAHADRVEPLAVMYRQLNPQATMEQAIRDVGAQAIVALGLDPTQVMAQPGAPAPQPQPLVQPPHRPASVSSPRSPHPVAQVQNPFAQMAMEDDNQLE